MRNWDRFQNTRVEYKDCPLEESDATASPFDLFEQWYEEAVRADIQDPNAVVLSTIDDMQQADSRVVLIKLLEDEVFYFFTNYESKKGRDLLKNPKAALVFYWKPLHRQIRMQGKIQKAATEISDEYFSLRPRGAQLGAIVSPQSTVLRSRDELQQALDAADTGEELRRPAHWGGYGFTPENFEFWQGRQYRLHDRLYYTRVASRWTVSRLAP